MKLLIVRHGDPDYTIDSLTEKGWREINKTGDQRLLCFTVGKGKGYCVPYPEKDEPNSHRM